MNQEMDQFPSAYCTLVVLHCQFERVHAVETSAIEPDSAVVIAPFVFVAGVTQPRDHFLRRNADLCGPQRMSKASVS